MTCGFVTIELRPLTYGKLTNQSVTYVSGTCVTLDSGLYTLSKRGVQATWQIRIGEVHPRSYPAASSFSTTFATDLL